MSNIAIKVENLSKAYQLGQIGTGTISRDLERWWTTTVRGKEDPFLKIGQTNDRTVKGDSDIVWSLRDINFEIEQGDAVGIIGRNGAGKSTLLKLLSRVTAPTTGNIKVKGRIASLLEVGTGFHPELSGRENIYLNGAILGMRKKEITRKLDEIIDFSGVERYIDTPVKRYSSGMYVRLAFAVAAHLESEILIVDEVLAVGDAEFQKKCLGKMGDISKGEGRTVIFVSHNLTSVSSLCPKGIVLEKGNIMFNGDTSNAIKEYNNLVNSSNINSEFIKSVQIGNSIEFKNSIINSNDSIYIKIDTKRGFFDKSVYYAVFVYSNESIKLFALNTYKLNTENIKSSEICFVINNHNLIEGEYQIEVITGLKNDKRLETISNMNSFNVNNSDLIIENNKLNRHFGLIYYNYDIVLT
jgi:lipopolysaccharide transport system ATP-binding protein